MIHSRAELLAAPGVTTDRKLFSAGGDTPLSAGLNGLFCSRLFRLRTNFDK